MRAGILKNSFCAIAAAVLSTLLLVGCGKSRGSGPEAYSPISAKPISGTTIQSAGGMVVSVSGVASGVGRDVLLRGGNAVDAAVATAFTLAVTFPEAGNIGGGGFMVIYPGDGRAPVVVDYRETAPSAATADMFVTGPRTQSRLVGVPGTVRGLALAHEKYGHLPWRELIAPAASLAAQGFEVNQTLAASLNGALARPGQEAEEMRRVLGKPGGGRWTAGDHLLQPELAQTLHRIAESGPDAFYKGPIADALVATVAQGGGIISSTDLSAYQAKLREPIHGTFHGYDIYAPPPPSSGGICLVEMLNILERYDLKQEGRWSPEALHLMTESMRLSYLDRARYLGDSDFVSIPPFLVTKEHAAKLASSIDAARATPSDPNAATAPGKEGAETTHFSVMDGEGMAVSNTFTLEQSFGGRIMVRGMGFLLNNEMGDFNPQPGVTDRRGLIGTTPNQIAPGKRMLSSMTPVIVTKNGRVVMVTGSPGGRSIINTVLCVVLNRLEFDMPPREAVDAPRFSHTWLPDALAIEPALVRDHGASLTSLRQAGYEIAQMPAVQGDAHSIFILPDGMRIGVADTRRDGLAASYQKD